MEYPPIETPFLEAQASLDHIWRGLRLNVQEWYERYAVAQGDREMERVGELRWTLNHVTIPSEEALPDSRQIDAILDWYRRHDAFRGAIFWYLHPTPPTTLGARLYARGVRPNWSPHWMWCDLRQLAQTQPPAAHVEIRPTDASDETDSILVALSQQNPRLVWHIVAMQQGKHVGGCILNVATGEWGVGGLFDMWVMPKARRHGIGTALAQAACGLARQLGCHHVVLNATDMGEPIYRRVGFTSLGYGQTWFLPPTVLAAPPPTETQILFLEAIGVGDIPTLEAMRPRLVAAQMQEPTRNGMTPLEIAVRCQQPASAAWLAAQGVIPDIIPAWDLGWKERVPILIAEHPDLVRHRGGRWTATPLHTAIERDDRELAELLLTVPNDLESKDEMFQETPLAWARRLQRTEILALIERVQK